MKLKMFLSVAIIVGAAVLVTGATLALFTSEAVVGNNTLAAGKLELTIETPEVRNFTIDNIYPGQELDMSEVEITNSGTLPYYLKAVISETVASPAKNSAGYLPEKVNLFITLTGPNGEETYKETTLVASHGQDLVWLVEANGAPLVIEPGETVSFRLFGQLDLSANNDYQESEWEGMVTFTAVQSDAQGTGLEGITWSE